MTTGGTAGSRKGAFAAKPWECDKCGQPHPRGCRHHKRDGTPCGGLAMTGQTECYKHGGSAAHKTRAAALRVVESEVRSEFARLGKPVPIDHPVRELVLLAGERKAWKELIRGRVEQLAELTKVDELGTDREMAAVRLYTEAMRDNEQGLVNLARLDLDARLVRLEEEQARLLWDAIEKALTSSLSAGQVTAVREAIAVEIRRALPEETP